MLSKEVEKMSKYLTSQQEKLLELINDYLLEYGQAPTYKELSEKLDVRSLATIALHIKALARKGYIQVVPGAHRGIRVMRAHKDQDFFEVPVIGVTAGGPPILAEENVKNYEKLNASAFTGIPDFLLEVKGDSMIEAGINEGDLVAVKKDAKIENGDIVVFMVEDESTVKRFYREKDCVILKPANKNYPNIIIKDDGRYLAPVGKVVGVLKK
jgi:repressor LexA